MRYCAGASYFVSAQVFSASRRAKLTASVSMKSPSLCTLPNITLSPLLLDSIFCDPSGSSETATFFALSSLPLPPCLSSLGPHGGSTYCGSMPLFVRSDPRPFKFSHLTESIRPMSSCGSLILMLKDEAATVAAEARFPIEPSSLPLVVNRVFGGYPRHTFSHSILKVTVL